MQQHVVSFRATLHEEAAGLLPLGGAHLQPDLMSEFAEFRHSVVLAAIGLHQRSEVQLLGYEASRRVCYTEL